MPYYKDWGQWDNYELFLVMISEDCSSMHKWFNILSDMAPHNMPKIEVIVFFLLCPLFICDVFNFFLISRVVFVLVTLSCRPPFPLFVGDLSKFGRGDTSSPSPATTLAQTQQNQTQTHHTTQQPFLNPALPPGYSYTSLPYYTGMPGLPNTFQYGPAVFPVRKPKSPQAS